MNDLTPTVAMSSPGCAPVYSATCWLNQSSFPSGVAAHTWWGMTAANVRNCASLSRNALSARTRSVVSTTIASTPAGVPLSSSSEL